jgi:hypothetical protein
MDAIVRWELGEGRRKLMLVELARNFFLLSANLSARYPGRNKAEIQPFDYPPVK